MKNKCGIIYIATSPSGRMYIGKTTVNLGKRIKKHYSDIKYYDNKFYRALKKYSVDDWKWDILYGNVPLQLLDIAEICSIYTYDTFYNGYNSTPGGDGARLSEESLSKLSKSLKGRVFSEEHKLNLSIAMRNNKNNLGKIISESTKQKISKSNLGKKRSKEVRDKFVGKNNPMYGKIFSEKHRRRLSESRINRAISENAKQKIGNSNAKNLYLVIRPDGRYEKVKNLSKFCRENGLSVSAMVRVSKNKNNHHKKYKCQIIKDYNK